MVDGEEPDGQAVQLELGVVLDRLELQRRYLSRKHAGRGCLDPLRGAAEVGEALLDFGEGLGVADHRHQPRAAAGPRQPVPLPAAVIRLHSLESLKLSHVVEAWSSKR